MFRLNPVAVVVIPGSTGNLTDSRDGQTYKTVTIGSQIWMAENLNFKTDSSFCYNNEETNCTKYGRLYTWAAAMDSVGSWSSNGKGCGYSKTCSPTYPVRGVCPEGWHLPSEDECNTLFTAVGGSSTAGTKLKSTSERFGYRYGYSTDAFGFSALLAGFKGYNVIYYEKDYYAYFWSSTESGSYNAYYMRIAYNNDDVTLSDVVDKNRGLSVRCLKG